GQVSAMSFGSHVPAGLNFYRVGGSSPGGHVERRWICQRAGRLRRNRRRERPMPEAVIVSAARTPIGRAHKGTLVDGDAFALAQHVVVAALRRSGLDPALVDDIVIAETLYGGGDIARYVAIEAGIEHVPGAAVNRHCAAGLTAVTTAAGSIRAGMDRIVIAGGGAPVATPPRLLGGEGGTEEGGGGVGPGHRGPPR